MKVYILTDTSEPGILQYDPIFKKKYIVYLTFVFPRLLHILKKTGPFYIYKGIPGKQGGKDNAFFKDLTVELVINV